jgi:hypothetical protein
MLGLTSSIGPSPLVADGLGDQIAPSKRTFARHLPRSQKCQSRHLAPQQNRPLLDHLGAGEQRRYRAAFLNHALATS